jgi:hypothetical protein
MSSGILVTKTLMMTYSGLLELIRFRMQLQRSGRTDDETDAVLYLIVTTSLLPRRINNE